LLDSGIDGKGRPRSHSGDIQKLPPARECFAQRLEEAHALQRQYLNQAHRENVRYIERRRPPVLFRVERILRQSLQNYSGSSGNPWKPPRDPSEWRNFFWKMCTSRETSGPGAAYLGSQLLPAGDSWIAGWWPSPSPGKNRRWPAPLR